MRGPVFFFGGRGGLDARFSFPPPPLCSQCVPMGFLKFPRNFPKAPQFCPIWFAQVQLSCIRTEKVSNKGAAFVSNLQLGVERGTFIGEECAECSEKFGDGTINMAPSKKEVVRAPLNIN